MEKNVFLHMSKLSVRKFLKYIFQNDQTNNLKEMETFVYNETILINFNGEIINKLDLVNFDMEIIEDWYTAYPITEDVCYVYGGFTSLFMKRNNVLISEHEKIKFLAICNKQSDSVNISCLQQFLPRSLDEVSMSEYEIFSYSGGSTMNYDQLLKMCTRDSLTGVYNRKYIEFLINRSLSHSHDNFVFIMADLDDFKIINDTYGHITGDCFLSEFAKMLLKCFRPMGNIGRIGGDEFCVFLKVSSLDYAIRLIDNFYCMINNYTFTENHIKISCTMGIDYSNRGESNFVSMYEKADMALYEAKKRGKGQYFIFNE